MNAPPPRAFSLAETLLALAVASSAFLGVLGSLAAALNTSLECRQQTAAALLAQQMAGQWSADGRGDIVLVNDALQSLLSRRERPSETEAAYVDGSSLPSAAHFARIDRLPAGTAATRTAERLHIRIETPAGAPVRRRQVHSYVTLAFPPSQP